MRPRLDSPARARTLATRRRHLRVRPARRPRPGPMVCAPSLHPYVTTCPHCRAWLALDVWAHGEPVPEGLRKSAETIAGLGHAWLRAVGDAEADRLAEAEMLARDAPGRD